MTRTRGTRNREGHKAGGARKGAGRKRKACTELVSESSESSPIAGPPSTPDNYIDVPQIHPDPKQYITAPHHVPPLLNPMFQPRETLSDSKPSFLPSYAGWESASCAKPVTFSNDSSSSPTFDGQKLAFPARPSRLLDPSLMSFPEQSESELMHADITDARTTPAGSTMDYMGRLQELQQQIEQRPNPSPSDTASTNSFPPSHPSATRSRLVNIAPALPSQQHRTWMFPYPLPTIISSPFHRLAIVSQGSSGTRRRRRCAVCIKLGREETSYDCPGRGDRSRCPLSQGRDKATGMSPKFTHRPAHKLEENQPSIASSSSSSSHIRRDSSLQPMAPTLPLPPVFTPHGYIPLAPDGQPVQHYVLSSGETTKRRARRCMVCVARGRDGASCAGRGSRTWCPDYDEALDARTIKWPSLSEGEPEPVPVVD